MDSFAPCCAIPYISSSYSLVLIEMHRGSERSVNALINFSFFPACTGHLIALGSCHYDDVLYAHLTTTPFTILYSFAPNLSVSRLMNLSAYLSFPLLTLRIFTLLLFFLRDLPLNLHLYSLSGFFQSLIT